MKQDNDCIKISNAFEVKAKSKSELEQLRKQEILQKGKYYEKKIHKEYRIEVPNPYPTSLSPKPYKDPHDKKFSANYCEYSYQEFPKFKTKTEMLEAKKFQLLEELNNSCNYKHLTQYDRLLKREKQIKFSPSKEIIPLHEKIRLENMQHFSEKYGNRPTGVHGKELPKFAENLREYWKVKTPSETSRDSRKKLFLVRKPEEVDAFDLSESFKSECKNHTRKRIAPLKMCNDTTMKPNQIEPGEIDLNKKFMKNSRWTGYHYVFLQKGQGEFEKNISKSITPDVSKTAKEIKTPKSLIVQRMMKKGGFSPGKDQLRSTGFS